VALILLQVQPGEPGGGHGQEHRGWGSRAKPRPGAGPSSKVVRVGTFMVGGKQPCSTGNSFSC